MAITLVQHTQKDTSGASTTLAFGSNVTANNLLVVVVRAGNGTGSTITVDDAAALNNSWSHGAINIDGTNGQSQQLWYTVNGTTGADTVKVTLNTSATIRMAIFEYSGTATSSPLDIESDGAQGNDSNPVQPSSFTPTSDNSLVLAFCGLNGGKTITPNASFNIEERVPPSAGTSRLGVQDWIQTTKTSTQANFSIPTSTQWMHGYAVFKIAPAATPIFEDDSPMIPLPRIPEIVTCVWG